MITNKLKSVLSLRGLKFVDYARKLNITPQSLQTKSKKDAYKIKDLIEFADLTNTTLALIDICTGEPIVTFEVGDINEA